MKTVQVLLACCIGVGTLLQTDPSLSQPVQPDIQQYVSKNGRLKIEIASAKESCQTPPHWLNEGRGRRGCILRLAASRDGIDAYIPVFSYSFLGTPESVFIEETREGYALKLIGGDAASSYIATFTLEQDILTKRKISSANFPEETWEETTYKFNLSNR